MRVYILFILSISCVFAKRLPRHIIFGKCYQLQTDPTIDLTKWSTGKWYETQRYVNEFQGTANCSSQVYFYDEPNNKLDVVLTLRRENGSVELMEGKVNITKSDSEISMTAAFPHDTMVSSFDIFATDVDNFAIVYSCWQTSNDEFLPEKQERMWVLSRTPTMTNETITIVQEALMINGTNIGRYLDEVSQDGCP